MPVLEESSELEAEKELQKPVQEYPLQLSIVWKNESQNIASLSPDSLLFVIRCVRCREERNQELPGTGLRESRCPKCALIHTIRSNLFTFLADFAKNGLESF